MHPRIVQDVRPPGYPEKSCALLEGPGADSGNLPQLLPAGIGPMFLPVCHYVSGGNASKPRHMFQQRG